MKKINELAINGGSPVRSEPFPPRRVFGEEELAMVGRVFEDSWQTGRDFSYQGKFEQEFTDGFVRYQGGEGYADAVSSGTAAIWVSLAALGLPPDSEVILSPVNDAGGFSPVALQGYKAVIADSAPDSYNTDVVEFEKVITPKTRAAIISHVAGIPAEIEDIVACAEKHGIRIIEDCSQSTGARYRGRRVGNHGTVAAFSTMFSKNLTTGSCGGIVHTKDKELHDLARCYADRGKPFHHENFDPKDYREFLFPALNFNQNEIACAIGISVLNRLDDIVRRRRDFTWRLYAAMADIKSVKPIHIPEYVEIAPFFILVKVETERLRVSKAEFGRALAAEGLWINHDYRPIISEWMWARKYCALPPATPNVVAFRDTTINILFHENFGDREIRDIVEAIGKVEKAFLR